MPSELGRRRFVGGLGAAGLLAVVARPRLDRASAAVAARGRGGVFLNAHELDTLRAVTARLLPGPPEDPDPGALDARCAEAIDALLGAFRFSPPLIHAGGPFSGRAGTHHDDFADFVPLDRLAELGWRIRLEGTRGRPERSFAGPVVGLQQVYRDGLAALDRRARPAAPDFASAPSASQDVILRGASQGDFVTTVLSDTLDTMYGAPEYHGNRGLVGWRATRWPGDVQPRGYTDRQVRELDPRAPRPIDSASARAALARYAPGVQDLR